MKYIYSLLITCLLVANSYSQATIKLPVETLSVKTVDELINAVGPNRVILLSADTFPMGGLVKKYKITERWKKYKINDYLQYSKGFCITNVTNMVIKGTITNDRRTFITTSLTDDFILSLSNCENIMVENILCDHTPITETISCDAGCIFIGQSKNITIKGSNLMGSGTEGIDAWQSSNLLCENVVIEDCSNGALHFNYFSSATFKNCTIRKNTCNTSMVSGDNCTDFKFLNCEFSDNAWYPSYLDENTKQTSYIMYVSNSAGPFEFNTCSFTANEMDAFTNFAKAVVRKSCTFTDNDALKK